jgi:hypothetical protein
MYEGAVDRGKILCLCQQTNVRRDELYEQPVPGAERRETAVPSAGPLFAADNNMHSLIWYSLSSLYISLCLKVGSLRFSQTSPELLR